MIDIQALTMVLMKESTSGNDTILINEATARYRANKIAKHGCCEKARSTHCFYSSNFKCPDHGNTK